MAKIIAKFNTKPINTHIDPEGGHSLQLQERPVYDDQQVFEEVVKEKTLPFDKDMLQFAFVSVLKTMALKVSRDCIPRRIGNYIKFAPSLRGKVPNPFSSWNPRTCSGNIVVNSMSGLEKSIDENYVQFVNARGGVRVTVQRLSWLGAEADGELMKGRQILATGINMEFLPGDTVTLAWKTPAGDLATLDIVPLESDVSHMLFAWPEALDALAEGTPVTVTFRTRGGVEDGDAQENVRHTTVRDAADPAPTGPAITSVTGGGGGALAPGYGITIRGRGLALGEGDHVGAKTTTEAGEVDVDITGFVQEGDDETIQLGDGAWDEIGTPTVDTVTFTVKGASYNAHVG